MSDFTPTSAPHAAASSSRGFVVAARTSSTARRWLRWFRTHWRDIIRWALLSGRGGLSLRRRDGESEDAFLGRVGFFDEVYGGDCGPPGWALLGDVDCDGRFSEGAFGGFWFMPSSREWRAEGGWHHILRRAMTELGGAVMRHRLAVVDALRVWASVAEDGRRMYSGLLRWLAHPAVVASHRARLGQAERDVQAAMGRLRRARDEERRAMAAAVGRG